MNGIICGKELTFLIDTGSDLDCLDKKIYDGLPDAPELVEPAYPVAYSVNGDPIRCYGMIRATIQIPYKGITSKMEMVLYIASILARRKVSLVNNSWSITEPF